MALQVLLPLSYYWGDDTYDERFAWRMFSTVRLTECRASAREIFSDRDIEPLELTHHLQIAWVNLIERNRGEVVRRFLHRRCQGENVTTVETKTVCRARSGEQSIHYWNITCESGRVNRSDEILQSP